MAHIFDEEAMRSLMGAVAEESSAPVDFNVLLKANARDRTQFRSAILQETLERIKAEVRSGREANAKVYEGLSYEVIALERELTRTVEELKAESKLREDLELELEILELELQKHRDWY